MGRYDAFIERLKTALTTAPAETPPALRSALIDGRTSEAGTLASYADKVRKHAWTVTDEDVESLKRAGHSEDSIFEVTTTTAVGAALARLDKAMSLMKGSAK